VVGATKSDGSFPRIAFRSRAFRCRRNGCRERNHSICRHPDAMSLGFDVSHIQRAFGRAALTYSQHSSLQRDVEDRLLERLDYFEDQPRRVLDIGCGPGRGTLALRKRFSDAQIVALDLVLPMLKTIRPGWLRPVALPC